MKKFWGGISVIGIILCVTCLANADIINTSVSVSASVLLYDSAGNTIGEAYDTNSGIVSASTSVLLDVVEASSILHINTLTPQTANLNFNFIMDANNYPGYGGSIGAPGNASITYHADIDTVLIYSWNFDYLGSNPFGMNYINIYSSSNSSSTQIAALGNVGMDPRHHEGFDTLNLLAGNDYLFNLQFQSNVGGGIGSGGSNIEGGLTGNISFNFNDSYTPVPEPSTMLLLGSGLIGLWGLRKKFKR